MKTKTFLLLCFLFTVACNRQEEFTTLGHPASVQDKMNGKVQKVVLNYSGAQAPGKVLEKLIILLPNSETH